MSKPEPGNIFWRACTNRTLSTWLLIVITAVLVVGTLLPNPVYMTPEEVAAQQVRSPLLLEIGARYNQEKLITGYLFGTIGIFLVVSATLCSIDRLLARRRGEPGDEPEGGGTVRVFFLQRASADQTREFGLAWLQRRSRGMSIRQCDNGLIVARRGRYGFWGSILFHTALVTLLMGMAIFYLGGTRGWLSFTEGQGYLLVKERFTHLEKEPVWGAHLPPVHLELLKQYSQFAPHDMATAVEHVARFRVTDPGKGDSYVRDVRINQPLRIGWTDFILTSGGFATRFQISDPAGSTLFDSFVNLREASGTKDDFHTSGGQLHVQVRFFPDFSTDLGRTFSKSQQLINPVATIVATRDGVTIFNGPVQLGQQVQFGGYRASFSDVRRWVSLEVSSEPGIDLFFFCAFIGMIGLVARMLDPDEYISLMVRDEANGTMVDLRAVSRHFPGLMEGVVSDCMAALATWQDSL